MLISDQSTARPYAALAGALEDRIVAIETARQRRLAELGEPPADTDLEFDWQLPWYRREARLEHIHLYLHERAKRPLLKALRNAYLKTWGRGARFSYFFPQHTLDTIWRRAHARMQDRTRLAR